MKKPSLFHLDRHLIRPCIYQSATRFGVAMLISYLWHTFANPNQLSLNTYAFFFMFVVFVLLAWMCYLRMDGMRIPRLKMDFLTKIVKKSPMRSFTDMSDYTDEEIVSFADLDDEEKDKCRFVADLCCAVLFLALSFF